MLVDDQSSSGGKGERVGLVGWLCLLRLLLPLFAQTAFSWEMHAPCHVMLAPMVSILSHLLTILVAVLGWHLLLHLVILLLGLVTSDLFVLCFLIATLYYSLANVLDNVPKLLIELEVPLVGIEHSQHGHSLVIVGGFGSPYLLYIEPMVLVHGRGHEGLVGDSGAESPIEVVFVFAADVLLEVVAINWPSRWPSLCCFIWHNFGHLPHLPCRISRKQSSGLLCQSDRSI
jgi:hypothetical protein